jgi:CTP synthase (UTP-ammonia lyase)
MLSGEMIRTLNKGVYRVGVIRIGLVGEYSASVKAHRGIPVALAMAAEEAGCEVQTEWLTTTQLAEDVGQARRFDGIWVTPNSPYASMQGALGVIRLAREEGKPFMGTCGGFQHVLIEYARNVLGIEEAEHAESNPDASVLFVTPLVCALRDVKGPIYFKPGSRISRIYGVEETSEEYNCGFGLNPTYKAMLEAEGVGAEITGWDLEGDARVLELPVERHPFFIATLYQPERSALAGERHPLIGEYARAAMQVAGRAAQGAATGLPVGR